LAIKVIATLAGLSSMQMGYSVNAEQVKSGSAILRSKINPAIRQ